jgi:hypothetical protein
MEVDTGNVLKDMNKVGLIGIQTDNSNTGYLYITNVSLVTSMLSFTK